MSGVFVTGTDTGVGKTLVAAALLHGYRRAGLRVAGMKPVAAGAVRVAGGWDNDDVRALRAASNVEAPLEEVNPYCFALPVAPHLAAAEAGEAIDLEHIAARYLALSARADVVVVEGAGGLLVPLGKDSTLADLALRLRLPVVLVVGMRLGCLNHALLTQEALAARSLDFAGWVANRIDADMPRYEENLEALAARLRAPLLARIGWMAPPDPEQVAAGLLLPALPAAALQGASA